MTLGVSIVIPCKNEAPRIAATLDAVLAWCRDHLDAHEILVVDDGSTDDTVAVVRGRYGDAVGVVELPVNRGKGHAIRRGVERATLPLVLFLDADHAIHVRHLESFLGDAAVAPVVVGSKRHPHARVRRSWSRRVAGRAAQWLIGRLAVSGIRDTQCGFKLLHTEVARELLAAQRIERFGYDFELLWLARARGLPIVERPVECTDRGDGSVRPSAYLRTLGELLRFAGHRMLGHYRGPIRAPARSLAHGYPPTLPGPAPASTQARRSPCD